MSVCAVCGAGARCEELAHEVFTVDWRHFLGEGVPCTVCSRRGEQSFSRKTAEKVRLMPCGEPEPTRSVSMQVYQFVAR